MIHLEHSMNRLPNMTQYPPLIPYSSEYGNKNSQPRWEKFHPLCQYIKIPSWTSFIDQKIQKKFSS